MTTLQPTSLTPGQRVRIEQQIVQRDGVWTTAVEGEVLSIQLEPTGSWYAHGRRDKLWLPRLRLKKPDGELTTLNLDMASVITLLN
ncbi:MAG: hypothetical protein HJJLKODD_02232 [Phycisphaerae bacterium]|nr:hypothetical protein [Phycisphaerae bacterium]